LPDSPGFGVDVAGGNIRPPRRRFRSWRWRPDRWLRWFRQLSSGGVMTGSSTSGCSMAFPSPAPAHSTALAHCG